jgi:hypothetical protein
MDISIAEQFDINDKEWSLRKCKQFLKFIQIHPTATSIEKEPSDENHVFLPKYFKSVVDKTKKVYKWKSKELDDIFIAIFRFLHEYYPEINKYQLNTTHNEKISQWNNNYPKNIAKNKEVELQNQFIGEINSKWIPGFEYLYDFEKDEGLTFADNHGILAIVIVIKKWSLDIRSIYTKYRKSFMEEIEKDPRITTVIFFKPTFGKKWFPWDVDKKMWWAIRRVNELYNKNSIDSDQKNIAQTSNCIFLIILSKLCKIFFIHIYNIKFMISVGVETFKNLEGEDFGFNQSFGKYKILSKNN